MKIIYPPESTFFEVIIYEILDELLDQRHVEICSRSCKEYFFLNPTCKKDKINI